MTIAKKNIKVVEEECSRLLSELDGVLAVVLASVDGFDVANAVTAGMDATKIAAMASSISALGTVVSQEATIGTTQSVTVKTENGFVYITNLKIARKNYILNIVASNSALLAQIMYQCGQSEERLSSI